MTSMTKEMLLTLLTSRIDLALDLVSENPEYLTVCKQQGKTKHEVDGLFERFSREEHGIIKNYYEGETHKGTFEIRAAYLQGMRDCYAILGLLSDLRGGIVL